MGSDDVTIFGDKFNFDSANSSRVRAGARLSHEVVERVRPYVGVYYDYEFDGEASGSVYGNSLKSTDVGGGTVIGELGLTVIPCAANQNVSLDFGVQGHTGRRDGVAGSFRANIKF